MANIDHARKTLRSITDSIVADVESWTTDPADPRRLSEWKKTLNSLQSTLAWKVQETELHRRQIMVIKSEMEVLERSARSTAILDRGASIGVSQKAGSMANHLNEAKIVLAEMEEDEMRLRDAVSVAEKKISVIESAMNEQQDL